MTSLIRNFNVIHCALSLASSLILQSPSLPSYKKSARAVMCLSLYVRKPGSFSFGTLHGSKMDNARNVYLLSAKRSSMF